MSLLTLIYSDNGQPIPDHRSKDYLLELVQQSVDNEKTVELSTYNVFRQLRLLTAMKAVEPETVKVVFRGIEGFVNEFGQYTNPLLWDIHHYTEIGEQILRNMLKNT